MGDLMDGTAAPFIWFMSKKNIILIAVVLALAGVYVVGFANWFKPKTIQISHTARPGRFRNRPGGAANVPLPTFGLGGDYKLTEIKVVPLAELQTNPLVQPVWHLVSDSNSVPINHFTYGQGIRGMKPEVPGARPQPLQPNVTYRLLLHASSLKGQHDFQAAASPQ
jgi:hypothetical protein